MTETAATPLRVLIFKSVPFGLGTIFQAALCDAAGGVEPPVGVAPPLVVGVVEALPVVAIGVEDGFPPVFPDAQAESVRTRRRKMVILICKHLLGHKKLFIDFSLLRGLREFKKRYRNVSRGSFH